jgi:protocatechuate 3,4-dioxygenase beta subunit
MLKGALAVVVLVGSARAEPFLAGSVTDARGAAVPGAVVSVVKVDARWRAVAAMGMALPLDAPLAVGTTDEGGAFRIDAAVVPAGLHAIAVAAPGAPAVLRWHERVAFGGPTLPSDLDLRVPALARTSGLALDETGGIVAGAQVMALCESATDAAYVVTTTDTTGRFEMSVLQDATLTLVGSAGSRWGIVRAPVSARSEITLGLHLATMEVIEGVVVAQGTERPLAGIRIRTQAPTWDPVAPTQDEATLPAWGDAPLLSDQTTADDGRFTTRVPEGGIALTTSPRSIAQRVHPGKTQVREAAPLRGTVVDDRGAPVAGADVRWTELPDAARTDDQGRFELLPDTNAIIVASTADGGVRSIKVASIVQDMRITLPALAALRGTVRAGDAPAANVTVRATTDAWDVLTATDDAGRFDLTLRGVKRLAAQQGPLVAEATPGASVVLSLRPAGRTPPPSTPTSSIRVKVTDESGNPLAGAIARAGLAPIVEPPERPLAAAGTGADGVALLQVEGREPQDVFVSRPGRAPQWIRGVKPGADASARLQPGATLQGTIRDADGHPVGGAIIAAEREVDRAAGGSDLPSPAEVRGATSDVAGAYVLRDVAAGTHAIDVVAAGYASAPRQRVTLVAGRSTLLDVTLAAGATLRGLVHDATGPVAGAVVKATAHVPTFSGESFGVGGSWRGTYTSDDGTFAIDGLQAEQWYDVDVVAEWHGEGSGGGRPSESVVDVALVATGAITGEVEGDSTGARVQCAIPSPDERRDRRDRYESGYGEVIDGKFSIDMIAPGQYTCTVDSEIASATLERVDVRASVATPVVVHLQEKPYVMIEVLAADTGLPIAGASANLRESSATSDADGHARLALPAPRDAASMAGLDEEQSAAAARWARTVGVRAEGYEYAALELPSPLPKSLTVKLQPLPKIRGRVVDAAGLPAAGAEVMMAGAPANVLTDDDGRFEITNPMSSEDADQAGEGQGGSAQLTARRVLGDATEEGSVEVPADATAPVLITLARIEPAELTVIVRDADGVVAGARVSVLGEDMTQGTTSAEGRFVASHLKPGDFSVMVETESGGMAMHRGIELSAGEHAQETVVLGEGWTIDGRVVRADRPVEGAQVLWTSEASGAFGPAVITRADGSYRAGPVSSDENEVRLIVMSPDRAIQRQAIVHRGDPPVVTNLAVVTLQGRVLSGDAPVAEARLRIQCSEEGGRMFGRADASGSFQIEAPGDNACDLVVRTEDGPAMSVPVRTIAEGVQDLGDLRLESRSVHGHASFPEGQVVEALEFQLLTPAGARITSVTAPLTADGGFELQVSPGPQMFLAQAAGGDLAWIGGSLEPGAPLELQFAPGGSLEILATAADGAPGEGYARAVEWNGQRLAGMSLSESAIEAGHGMLTGLASGHVVVEVSTNGGITKVEADILAGETKRVSVTLR